MSKQWAKWSNNICLLTTSNAQVLASEKRPIPDKIHKVELTTRDYRTTKSRSTTNHLVESKKQSWHKQLAIKAINSFPFLPIIGEGGKRYFAEGIKEGKAFLTKNPKAIIYSSFRPYADHLIAHRLKKLFPKSLWVADFRDLHLDPLYKHYLFEKRQIEVNKRILKHADLVTTVSEGLATQLRKLSQNVHVLKAGIEMFPPQSAFRKFTISYTGSLFLDERDPRPVMKAVSELLAENKIDQNQFQLIYAGKDGPLFEAQIREHSLESIFSNKGMISRDEALNIQQKSHLNLLLTASSKEYSGILTGKFYEYLAAGRKMLLIIKGNMDAEFEQLFRRDHLGYIYTTNKADMEALKSAILDDYQYWQKTQQAKSLDMELIKNNYRWETSFNEMIRTLGI